MSSDRYFKIDSLIEALKEMQTEGYDYADIGFEKVPDIDYPILRLTPVKTVEEKGEGEDKGEESSELTVNNPGISSSNNEIFKALNDLF